jgi:hypothetical protein
MRLSAVVILVAASLAVAAPASAAPTRTAQRFSDAALYAHGAIKADRVQIQQRFEALNLRLCFEALEGAPRRAEDTAVALVVLGMTTALSDVLMPHLTKLVADLDAVPTRDRVLRSGRGAWRRMVQLLGEVPRVEDPCGQLARWRDAGWAPEAEPALPDFDVEAAEGKGKTIERKLRRAARRLRKLGVSRRAARRFTGATLLDGVPLLDGEVSGESQSSAPPPTAAG